MGHPRKRRKQYDTPGHPWQKSRIDEEKKLTLEYGFSNKKEIWKLNTLLINFKTRAKQLLSGETTEKSRNELMAKLSTLGILPETATVDDILGLTFRDLADRRLQSLVMRKGLARSVKQARQFITHGHIKIGERKIDSPSYLVLKSEEEFIRFSKNSNLSSENHPERSIIKKESKVNEKTEAKVNDDNEENNENSAVTDNVEEVSSENVKNENNDKNDENNKVKNSEASNSKETKQK